MLEREAMAILVSAGIPYMLRTQALKKAGGALELLDDPQACADILAAQGVSALKKAIRESDRILDGIYSAGVHLIALGEEGYPERLGQIPRPPHLLFVQGAAFLDDALSVAIVGTRGASEYGLRHTRRIARELSDAGACVVSGLAVGIDAAAHEGALGAQGRTVAVLGSALDRFFPMENIRLRDRMLDSGGSVVSEYPMGKPPTRYSFLHRNRIIAALAMGTLVTDGPVKSGALRTASDAAEYGREVFALPGNVDAPGSALPHKLIAEGAHLVTCAADILQILAPQLAMEVGDAKETAKKAAKEIPARKKAKASADKESAASPKSAMPAIPADMPGEERAVLTALLAGEKEFDQLAEETGLDGAALGAVLMGLEMDGLIDALPGLRYAHRA